jgi:hypothetical protein
VHHETDRRARGRGRHEHGRPAGRAGLADFYEQVTVLECDAFPVADVPRKGVPQGKHAHGLLARGRTVIEEFFPGWTDEIVGCGGVRGDIAGDVNWIGHGVTIKSAPSDMVGLLAARPVLEGNVRRRLAALPNVCAIEHCAALPCERTRIPAECGLEFRSSSWPGLTRPSTSFSL